MFENESPAAQPDSESQVFILRFWRESRDLPDAEPFWRGVVEHVGSGRRRFLQEPQQLCRFIGGIIGPNKQLVTRRSLVRRLIRFICNSLD